MNVRRHADADRVAVRLSLQGGEIVLEIEDDGVGIGVGGEAFASGVGVDGMRARLSSLNGVLTIESPGRGTRVRAAVKADAHIANSTQSAPASPASPQQF